MSDNRLLSQLSSSLVLVSCEGGFERVAFEMLLDNGRLTFSRENIRDITSIRSPVKLQETYLGYDYDIPLIIMRLLDSKNEHFQLGKLYRDRFPVCNIHTRPEAEILTVIKEGRYDEYNRKYKSRMKPSDYCKQILGLSEIKRPEFLCEYWDVESLITCAIAYKRLHKSLRDEHCLADLLAKTPTRDN